MMFGRDDDWHRVLAPSLLSDLEDIGDLLDAGHAEVDEDDEDDPGWHCRGSNGMMPHTLFRPTGKTDA